MSSFGVHSELGGLRHAAVHRSRARLAEALAAPGAPAVVPDPSRTTSPLCAADGREPGRGRGGVRCVTCAIQRVPR